MSDKWDDFDFDEQVVKCWPAHAQATWYAGHVPCGDCGYKAADHPWRRCEAFQPATTQTPPQVTR